jgi:16S rRNA G1207 methylase RsmC
MAKTSHTQQRREMPRRERGPKHPSAQIGGASRHRSANASTHDRVEVRDDDEAQEDGAEVGESSIDGLNLADPGVMQLATVLADPRRCSASDRVLLVHCGSLPGAPPHSHRLILDIRERENCEWPTTPGWLDFAESARGGDFDAAFVWPRAHLGKDFSLATLAHGGLALREGGVLYFAARKQKGGKSLAAKVEEIFGDAHCVEVLDRDRGYTLWAARRGHEFNVDLAHELCKVGYAVSDERFGDLELVAPAGVFSRKGLDDGSAALIDCVARRVKVAPKGILDLCCGVGPLMIWAAMRWPEARGLALDSNILAAQAARYNVAQAGLTSRVDVVWSDGLTGAWSAVEPTHVEDPRVPARGKIELALVNPPTHAPESVLRQLFVDLTAWMAPRGRAFVVVARAGTVAGILSSLAREVQQHSVPGYTVLEAHFA